MIPREVDPKLPQWWSDRIAAGWSRSRATAITDWRTTGDHVEPIDESLEERALAFGHGARSAYPHVRSWDALWPRLRTEWHQLGNVGSASWDHVADLIHHEWLRAAGPGGDAAPDTA